ncbi:MAG: AMIN domain-containing protein, partial [Lysobacteraceae bacterium]
MRAKGIRFEQVVLAAMLLAALCWNLVNAAEIKHLRIDTGATGTRAELLLDREGTYKLIDLHNPDRLVVDFPESHLGRGLKMPAANGVVKAVRTGQPAPGTVRIVFDLASSVAVLKPRIEQSAEGPRLVLEWPGDGVAEAAPAPRVPAVVATPVPDPIAEIANKTAGLPPASAPAGIPAAAGSEAAATVSQLPGTIATGVPTRIATGKPEPVVPAPQAEAPRLAAPRREMQAGMRPLVIAIDAGHGGQDPGAIGPSGNREKNVTLAIARELARQINATPGMKAYLTRDTDVFIPLNRRAVLARGAKADIFVSIHADAAENRDATGSSVYVLSTRGASSQRARWLADKENAADLIGGVKLASGDTLKSVLLDLTQSGQMKASSDAANHVLGSLGSVGKTRRVEHANFAVLRTSDVPAMLVETGFISNPGEEKRLADRDYQRNLAAAILDGVDAYFSRQPPPGTLYAARAQARQ